MNENERTILPSNIKQIGTPTGERRVYVEDYAATYLQQYANADGRREKAAFLVGQEINVDGAKALFISGVIQGRYSVQKNGVVQLTEKSRQYAQKQIDIYFKGLDIVGWAYIQPGYEDSIKEGIRDYQRENDGLQVMFLIDPEEKINSFFVWENEEFRALKGYIIYYEKNEGMHEYMLENKLKPTNDEYRLISDISLPQGTDVEENFEAEREQSEDRQLLRLRRREEKKTAGLMSTLSFVMLMVCFVMGAGLVQNDKRINRLELDLASLESELEAADGAQSVFAAEYVSVMPAETAETTTFAEETETLTEPPTEAAEPETKAPYKVEKGDTLSRISEKVYGTIGKMEEIMQLNGMDDADSLVEGMELTMPD